MVSTPEGERTVSLAYVRAPRVDSENGGFAAREVLRKLLLGKPLKMTTLYSTSDRSFCDFRAPIFDSLVETALASGAARLRDDASVKPGYNSKLEAAQEKAKSQNKGLWGASHIAIAKDVPKELFGSGRTVPSIVERVVSGDRVVVRAMMDADHHYYGPALIAGIRTPRSTSPSGAGEPYGDAARDLVASRLLQRDVRCIFHGEGHGSLPLITIQHPAGDIATSLLGAGFAKVAENQSSQVGSSRMLELRSAESKGKATGKNLWRAQAAAKEARDQSRFRSAVRKVLSADTFVLDGDRTVQLSSLAAPRKGLETEPWAALAKEYARALVIGRDVEVYIDGERPDGRELATIAMDGHNIADHIVGNGYATVVHRRDDIPGQSPFLSELSVAEEKAKSQKKGIWGKPPSKGGKQVVDASESVVRAKAYLGSLERRGRIPGIVDYVAPQGARLRVTIPSENAILSVVAAGIKVPRNNEEGASEAAEYVSRNYTQRDVEIKVLGTDKTGAFTCLTFLPGKKQSLSAALLAEGLASVFEPAANSAGLRREFDALQEEAQAQKKGIWANWVPEATPAITSDTEEESKSSAAEEPTQSGYQDAFVCSIDDSEISYRLANEDSQYQGLKANLATHFADKTATHSFVKSPRRNDSVIYKNNVGAYLRAKVTAFERNDFELELVDVGGAITAKQDSLRPLPENFSLAKIPALALTSPLAFIHRPPRDYRTYFVDYLKDIILNKRVVVSKDAGRSGVVIFTDDSKSADDSLNARLIDNGYTYLTSGSGAIYSQLEKLQTAAMRDRVGIWEYGDPRDDDVDA